MKTTKGETIGIPKSWQEVGALAQGIQAECLSRPDGANSWRSGGSGAVSSHHCRS